MTKYIALLRAVNVGGTGKLPMTRLKTMCRDAGFAHVSWHVELAIKEDQLDDFQTLTCEMVEFTRSEPGVLSYQRFASEDGKFVHGYERYADSAAALAHLRNFATLFSERFSTMIDRTRFTVFGQPSHELRAVLDHFGATYLKPFGDFAYW